MTPEIYIEKSLILLTEIFNEPKLARGMDECEYIQMCGANRGLARKLVEDYKESCGQEEAPSAPLEKQETSWEDL